jgi:chemotaxis protein histidine kinase CheA
LTLYAVFHISTKGDAHMSTRTIPVQVNNEYVQGAGVAVGAAGSHNDVVLEIAFSPLWDGLAKKITWLDANGENATLTILTTNMLKTGETTVYQVPIPAEPKACAGELTMTIKGATVSGSTETRATLSTSCTFRVLPSAYSNAADESGDVTPTQAEQLQAEIDDILETISAAEASATAAAASETAAAGSATLATEAKTAAEAAQAAAETAETNAETAEASAETAKTAAEAAQAASEAAQSAADTAQAGAEAAQNAAETAEGTATIKATESGQSAAAALASKNTAAGSAATAVDSAATAVGAATDAQTAQEAAEDAQGAAETSAASAAGSAAASESWAVGGTGTRAGEDTNNAHYWSIVAQGAAAGGVSTFNGRSGAVVPASGDYTPSMVGADASGAAAAALASAKSYADGLAPNYDQAGAAATVQGNLDAHTGNTANPHGVTAAQAGADPTGTAASAISTHNGATDAHSGLFAAKATLDTGSLTLKIGRDSTGVYIEY